MKRRTFLATVAAFAVAPWAWIREKHGARYPDDVKYARWRLQVPSREVHLAYRGGRFQWWTA